METMTTACVQLNAQASNKTEAVRLAGQLLVTAGYIAPAYIDSMLRREAVANTFLGAGWQFRTAWWKTATTSCTPALPWCNFAVV